VHGPRIPDSTKAQKRKGKRVLRGAVALVRGEGKKKKKKKEA
jgi:hypothetical protein